MSRFGTGPLISVALGAGFLATVSLVLPWFTIAGQSRSSIDLLSSASALDVIEGGAKVAVIGCWLLAPVLVAAAMLVAASGRHRASALFLAPVVIATFFVAFVGLLVDDIRLAWGALAGLVFAVLASVCAIMVVVIAGSNDE